MEIGPWLIGRLESVLGEKMNRKTAWTANLFCAAEGSIGPQPLLVIVSKGEDWIGYGKNHKI